MKIFMYIIIFFLENFMILVSSEYNILTDVIYSNDQVLNTTDGSDGYTAYKFSNTSNVNASISVSFLNDVNLVTPLIINIMFKFDKIVYSCLFAIIDSKEQLKLRLCLTADDENEFLMFFDGSGNINVTTSFTVKDPRSWQDLFLVLERNTIDIYIKCLKVKSLKLKKEIEDIYFPDNSTIYIGQSGMEKRDPFKGDIQKLTIYPETDNVKNICRDEIYIPDSLKESVKGEKGNTGSPGSPGEKGQKGEKGDKGDSVKGSKGDIGHLGPIGPAGARGIVGEKGDCQCSEIMVSALIKAMPEMKGPQGNPGTKGTDGITGRKGEIGPPGQKGDEGAKGEKGQNGLNGKEGPPGLKGEPGKDGVAGSPGSPGFPCKGARGETGKKGEKGETGLPGLKSDPGVPGTHGKDGAKGDKGVTGQKGEKGMPAKLSSILDADMDAVEKSMVIEKLKGYKGDKGDKGDTGPKGDIGVSGIPGKDGMKGQSGLQGPVGPEGIKGEVGPVGPKGIKGEPGQNGPPGIVPVSVLKSMKGPKGDQGKAGKNGARGYTGPKGQRGPVGPQGPKGSKGDNGAAGNMGPGGAPGERGQKGEKGDVPEIDLEKIKGEKGERGPEGMPGKPGEAGPPGVCKNIVASKPVSGPPGSPGSPGSRGPPGPSGPTGNPGLSFYGQKGEPGGIISPKTLYNFGFNSVDPDDEDVVYATETLIYRTTQSLIKRTKLTALGTLAFVLEEKLLLLRVEEGWQHVMMGQLLTNGLLTPNHMSPKVEEKLYVQKRNRKDTPPLKEDIKQKPKYSVRLIALDKPFSGKMETATNRSGRKAVDHECHVQSQRANIAGTFTAFLSNRVEDLKYIPKTLNKDVKVINIKGETLFDSWSEIFESGGNVTIKGLVYSFGLKNILEDPMWGIKAIWTGSTSLGIRKNDSFCQEWQSDNPKYFGTAIDVYHTKMVAEKKYSCDKNLIVLCVEVIGRKKRHISSRWRRPYSHLAKDRIEG